MKAILLAAAAMIAVPALAQTTTPPAGDQAMPMQSTPTAPTDSTMTPAPTDTTQMPQTDTSTAPTDGSMPQSSAPMSTGAMPGGSTGGMTAGGYQPAMPAMQGTMQPGATVRFQAAQTPDQAYPAPAPKASYPTCKKGQYDGCTQRRSPK